MDFSEHLRTTGGALKNWLVATGYDALAVGALWLVGLLIIRVPWAPLWALLGAVLQFVPHFGPVVALIGPAFAALASGGWERLLYVLILYAVVAVCEGLVFQPLFMKRRARVPVWASVLTPLVLGFFFSFWGVLASAPLLAIVFAYRNRGKKLKAENAR
jgi:predicted PurR-regulated permease PerM